MRFSLMFFWDKVNFGFFYIYIYKFESKFMLDWMKWYYYSCFKKKISNLGSLMMIGKSLINEDRYYEIFCVL